MRSRSDHRTTELKTRQRRSKNEEWNLGPVGDRREKKAVATLTTGDPSARGRATLVGSRIAEVSGPYLRSRRVRVARNESGYEVVIDRRTVSTAETSHVVAGARTASKRW